MTVLDRPTAAQAGGPTQLIGPPGFRVAHAGQECGWRYAASATRGRGYRIAVAPYRLTATIERTDEGFVATCPQLETLGYGPDRESAIADLIDATDDYMAVLDEDRPPLSPRIEHHALFLPLRGFPHHSWFAAIVEVRHDGQDAP